MYYVYILKNLRTKKFYTGATSNLRERLKDHYWHTVKTTKMSEHQLIFFCCFVEKEKAFDFEKYLKTGSGIAFRNRHFL